MSGISTSHTDEQRRRFLISHEERLRAHRGVPLDVVNAKPLFKPQEPVKKVPLADIQFSMGPKRPNKPDESILGILRESAAAAYGVGAKVIVTSGQERDKDGDGKIERHEQHGSNRHSTGLAADVKILRPDGTTVKATDADALRFVEIAAEKGVKGAGWGAEYMGGSHFHMDLVKPGAGQAHTWGSQGRKHRAHVVGIMSGKPYVSQTAGKVAVKRKAKPLNEWTVDDKRAYDEDGLVPTMAMSGEETDADTVAASSGFGFRRQDSSIEQASAELNQLRHLFSAFHDANVRQTAEEI